MGKRPSHVYTGMYTENHRLHIHGRDVHSGLLGPDITHLASTYFWTAYSSVSYNYIALATVCFVVLLSYMLPNISQKMHRTTELKAMKSMLDVMADVVSAMQKEVSRAEVACLAVAEQIGCLQGPVQDGATETLADHHDLAVCTSDSMRATQSAPAQVEKKIGLFRRIFFPNKNTSNKEIAIMSYLYTDSFDKNKNKHETNPAEPRNI